MGYQDISEAIKYASPELLIDYIIAKQNLTGEDAREQAQTRITTKQITLSTLFPEGSVLEKANKQLEMMNLAHCFDLSRCYSLYPDKMIGDWLSSNYVKTMEGLLFRNGFLGDKEPTIEKLTEFFNLMKSSFNTMAVTGQKTTFGLISSETFEKSKGELLTKINAITDQFVTQPGSLLQAAEEARRAPIARGQKGINYFRSNASGVELEREYCKYLIVQTIVSGLITSDRLAYRAQLFDFNHVIDKSSFESDHAQNAKHLVGALNITLAPPLKLPKIIAVDHLKTNQRVKLTFDSVLQATQFAAIYLQRFGVTTDPVVSDRKQPSQHSIQVSKTQYQQLVREQLVEFEQVKVPEFVSAETELVEQDVGVLKAIKLIQSSEGLGRLVSTSARVDQSTPEYEYFFKALDDPANERFSTNIAENIDRAVYRHPRTGEVISRTVDPSAVLERRFQEPITKPGSFEEKKQDWTIREERSKPKNTIFTKKMAHSLIPAHGKIIPFGGMKGQEANYFPIGVLSDIKQVDLKSERYIWSENMLTVKKHWIADHSVVNDKIYQELSEIKEPDTNSKRFLTELALSVETTVEQIVNKLNSKQYRPRDAILQKFMALASRQRMSALDREGTAFVDLEQRINVAYDKLDQRLRQEIERKHPKYSITLKELIAEQNQTDEASAHNEILAANTKGATQALYASKDALFDRLNLVLHAMRIKEAHGIDVPLLVLSRDKAPYHYTEALIKADLIEASMRIKEGNFPYDTYPVNNDDGSTQTALKSLEYQQKTLVDIIQYSTMKKLTGITAIQKAFQKLKKPKDEISEMADVIIGRLDLVGGESRERKLMVSDFEHGTAQEKERFFLRNVSLGNIELVQDMIENHAFKFKNPIELLKKSIECSDKNGHTSLTTVLNDKLELLQAKFQQVVDIKRQLKTLKEDGRPNAEQADPTNRTAIKSY